MAKNEQPAITFEAAIARLEEIVGQMESDQMPLDALLDRYEEGNKLITVCQEKLKSAEQRIEMVARKSAPAEPSPKLSFASSNPEKDPDVSLF